MAYKDSLPAQPLSARTRRETLGNDREIRPRSAAAMSNQAAAAAASVKTVSVSLVSDGQDAKGAATSLKSRRPSNENEPPSKPRWNGSGALNAPRDAKPTKPTTAWARTLGKTATPPVSGVGDDTLASSI